MELGEIGLVLLIIGFIFFLFSIPFIMEVSFDASVPFHAKDAYDIKYENEKLSFKTKDKHGINSWSFKGNCTVWYNMSGKRCHTLIEVQLNEIWEKVTYSK